MRSDRRVLIYGPQGTGKTLAAEALRKALGFDGVVEEVSNIDEIPENWIGCTHLPLADFSHPLRATQSPLLLGAWAARLLAGIHMHPNGYVPDPEPSTSEG